MLNILQQFIQTLLAFFAILIFAKLIGKQQIGQLTYYDYINGITIGSIAATLATDTRANLWNHLLDLVIFAALTFLLSLVVLKSRPARKILDGEPTVVIHNGKILENNLRTMRYNIDQLLMQLRGKEVFDIGDVEYAVLEPDGQLSVLVKSQKRTVTTGDLNLTTNYEGLSTELVVDGKIIHQNLSQNNLTESWLKNQLEKRQIRDTAEVALASLDSEGNLYIDLKSDHLQSIRDISDDPQNQ